jgi:protein TonB
MKNKLAMLIAAALLASCSTRPDAPKSDGVVDTTTDGTSTAATLHAYKQDIAQRIAQVNSRHVYAERPQALLRSVVVLKFSVDESGRLLRSEIQRSNRDSHAESTALHSLKRTAPFPKPAPHLLRHGKVEMSESWLFNNDGRFQLRSVALPQMDR